MLIQIIFETIVNDGDVRSHYYSVCIAKHYPDKEKLSCVPQ